MRLVASRCQAELLSQRPTDRGRFILAFVLREVADETMRAAILDWFEIGLDQNNIEIRRLEGHMEEEVRLARERMLGFSVGVASLVIVLLIALAVREPSAFLYLVVRVILALGSAGFALFLTGMLKVKIPGIRAGGALAVFVIVFFWNPAPLVLNEARTAPDGQSQGSVSAPTADDQLRREEAIP